MSDAGQARTFVRALLGDPGDHPWLAGSHVTVWTAPGRSAEWLPADDPEAIAQAIVAADDAGHRDGPVAVYLGLAPAPLPAPDPTRERHTMRVTNATAAGLTCLFLDVDIEGSGDHTTSDPDGARQRLPYAPDEASAHTLIDDMGLPPSLVVHSGHGLAAYWVFHEPWSFDDDGERGEATKLLRSWVATARLRAGARGWRVDPVGDLARVMRAPGSTNRKVAGDHRPVRITHDTGARYNPSDFTGYLADDAAIREMQADPIKVNAKVLEGVDLRAVWARCTSAAYQRAKYVPEWLDYVFDESERLRRTWMGQVAEHGSDGSTIDASIVRQLADAETPVELICEALLCRRLRFERGKAVQKVDPTERVDYLVRTLGKFTATSAAARAARDARSAGDARDEALEAYGDDQNAPVQGPAETVAVAETPGTGGPDGADEVAPVTVIPDPDREITTTAVGSGEPNEVEQPATLRVIDPDSRVVVESVPTGPDVDEPAPEDREQLADLAHALNLEQGFIPWGVFCRSGKRAEQHALAIKRVKPGRRVPGRGGWAVGEVKMTGWHAAAGWMTPATLRAHVRVDLHLACDPPKGWSNDGMEAWYGVIRQVIDDTPAAAVSTAMRELLVAHCPLAPFSLARRDGHAWLEDEGAADDPDGPDGGEVDRPTVAVSLALIERRIRELREHSPITPEEIMDVVVKFGASVHRGVTVREAGHVVHDTRTWVRVPPALLTDADWKAVRAAREAYEAERANARPSMVGREDQAR